MTLTRRDKALIWHPFTQEKTAEPPIAIARAKGSYLYDEHGKTYLDLISSWWVNLHGHAHPVIAEAIYKQSLELEHVIFAGFTHKPAVELCEKLSNLMPENLKRFFFSDNGSTAVEVALKLSYQYWQNNGETCRTKFLSFEGGYHGDTFGAMSVSKSGLHDHFQKLLFEVINIPYPASWNGDKDVKEKEHISLLKLRHYLENEHSNIAAFIAEPLVQGASGMRMCSPEYLKNVVKLIREYGILIIFDEVMTGFGRTGSIFAFEQVGCVPDFICLSKGLTGGFLPLALTIANNNIYEAFLGDNIQKAFLHGHSYTANPLGCAAAIASLDLMTSPDTIAAIKSINDTHTTSLAKLIEDVAILSRPRICGTIAAFDVKLIKPDIIKIIKEQSLLNGLLIRPLGNVVYFLPPYSVSKEELISAYSILGSIIKNIKKC